MAEISVADIELLRLLPHSVCGVSQKQSDVPAAVRRMLDRIDRLKRLGLLTATMSSCGPGRVNVACMLTEAGAAVARR
jgi:hypothetical protein